MPVSTPHNADEKELLLRLQEGDHEAFEQIYNMYAGRLAARLIQLLKSEDIAKDILQDIFIKIWEIRTTINPELSFAALLYKMATNRSKNIYRRNIYDRAMRLQVNMDKSHNLVQEYMNQSEAHTILRSALNKLTPRQREVYVLHKFEGRSYKEIGEILKISHSAINHHIQSATKQLKAILKPQSLIICLILAASFN